MNRADKFRNGVAGRAILPPRPKPDPVDTPGGLLQVPATRELKP